MCLFFVSDQILSDIFLDKNSTFHNQLGEQNNEITISNSVHTSWNLEQTNQSVSNLASNFSNNFNIEHRNNHNQTINQPPPPSPFLSGIPCSTGDTGHQQPINQQTISNFTPGLTDDVRPPIINQDISSQSVPLFYATNTQFAPVPKPPPSK